jgi:polyribonucleotide nucleotidyltransferase
MVNKITQDAEVGDSIWAGLERSWISVPLWRSSRTDGLIISQLDKERVNKVTDILNEGDEVLVKVLEIDKSGRIALSRKAALGERLSDVS